jgi:hypothetical protein
VLSVISSHDELHLVPVLLIDHGNESSFRGMLLMYYWVPFNRAYFCRISGCEQPSSTSPIITNLNNLFILFHTTRGPEPPSGKKNIHTYCRVDPKNPTCGLVIWVQKVITRKFFCRHIPSTRRTTVVALHSTGCSRLSPFYCLVVDKLLLVLLLSRCKVPPMGTPICHDRLALITRLNLLP